MMLAFQGSNLLVDVLGKCVGRCSIVEAPSPLRRVREDESRTFPQGSLEDSSYKDKPEVVVF
jgi:hypothetical protein